MVSQNRQPVGMGVEDLGQGGIFDTVLTIKSAKFVVKDFGKGKPQFQVAMVYTKEDGKDVDWSYNVGDATGWDATPDGLGAISNRENGKITKSSAFGVFLTELSNAGFPDNRRTGSLDFMFGTTFQSCSFVPEGTNMDGETRKEQLVASLVISLPGEVAGQVANVSAPPAPPVPPTPSSPASAPALPPSVPSAPVAANGVGDAGANALMSALKLGDSFTLQGVMAQVMQDLAGDAVNRDAAAGYVFTPEFAQMLVGAGYKVDSYNVSKDKPY